MNKLLSENKEHNSIGSYDQRIQSRSEMISSHELHKRNAKLSISKFISKKNLFFFTLLLMIIPLVYGCAILTSAFQVANSLQNGKYPWEDPVRTSSTYNLTVNVRGGVFGNLFVNVFNGSNIIAYDYVSSSSPYCTFAIPQGSYLVLLKIGEKTLSQARVNLSGNTTITLSSF